MDNKIQVVILSDDSYQQRFLFLEVPALVNNTDTDITVRKLINEATAKGRPDFNVSLISAGVGMIAGSNNVTMEYQIKANCSGAAGEIAEYIRTVGNYERVQVATKPHIALAMLHNEDWVGKQTIDLMDATPFLTITPVTEETC
jgi:hypothetical protein